jgi:archaellum component FlaC
MNPKLIPYIQRRKKEIATAKELLIKLEGRINSLENDLDRLDQHIPTLTTPEKVEKEIDQIEMSYWLVNSDLYGLNKIFNRPIKKGVDRTEYFLDR